MSTVKLWVWCRSWTRSCLTTVCCCRSLLLPECGN